MKTHGPNSPQSIRGLRERRKLRGLLDTRRMAEADLRVAEYVAAFGKGFHKVKNPGGGEDYIVADQTGGRTFAPGTSILLGSQTGMPGEAVLGGAPAGKKGGIARTRATRRRGSTAPAASNQYAFGNDGVDLFALLYADGTYVSTRGTSSTFVNDVVVGCILTDPTTLVGDGSALIYDDVTPGIAVWDVANSASYTYSAPAGWSLYALYPRYYGGAVYWIEYETGITGHADATGQFRLRTAATDLTGASTVATVTMTATDDPGYDHFHDPFLHTAALMVDSDGAVVYAYADTQSLGHGLSPGALLKQYRIALSGGAATSRAFGADTYPLADVSATSYPTDGSASGGFVVFDGTNVYAKTDDATNEATLLYAPALSGSALSINYSPAGTSLQVYNGNIYRNNSLITASAAVEAFDTVNYPDRFFYFGGD